MPPPPPDPSLWSLERRDGRLHRDGLDLCALAAEHGTPLHVVSARRLRERCRELRDAFAGYPGGVRIHYSYKTNPVAGVLALLHAEGLGAEVVGGHELWLARRLGVPGADIVFNGPAKTDDELAAALREQVGLVVVDGADELRRLEKLAEAAGVRAPVLLRICPDVIPRGMNASTGTGSRRNQFGFDPGSPDLEAALRRAASSPRLRLRGLHAHIGSGIHDVGAYAKAAERVMAVQAQAARLGAAPDVLDLGGGLGTELSREMTTAELLLYFGLGRLPSAVRRPDGALAQRWGGTIRDAVERAARRHGMAPPTLVLEPGRAVTSDAGLLLLRVGAVRERAGGRRFAVTDGGALTVSMMFLVELHAVLLANRDAPADGRTHVFGRLPSPLDLVYRGLSLPRLQVGDVLAVMDAGAYFTSTATNFGGPRPAVVMIDDGRARVVRRRETPEDLARVEMI